MNLQLILTGDLVSLRPLLDSDFEELYEVAKDPKIWEQHHSKRYLKTVFEPFFDESLRSNGALAIVDNVKNAIIGSSRYKTFKDFRNVVEIGWTFIAREYWGGSYNMEIKGLMANYAFAYYDNVIFIVDKNNMRSQKAMRKIGGREISRDECINYPKVSGNNLIFIVKKSK